MKSKFRGFGRVLNPLFFLIRYLQILRSLSQELLQRIHNGQIMSKNLEETTDLNDVKIFLY